MDVDEILTRLIPVLGEGPPLECAVLFGSAARNELRPDSDIDIGIIPADRTLSLANELGFQARLTLACRREVDLVRLDTASTLLRWFAAREGRPILETVPGIWVSFRAQAAAEYIDFAPALAHAEALTKKRAMERLTP